MTATLPVPTAASVAEAAAGARAGSTAAAVPFAAWLAGRVPGGCACLVLCGANIG